MLPKMRTKKEKLQNRVYRCFGYYSQRSGCKRETPLINIVPPSPKHHNRSCDNFTHHPSNYLCASISYSTSEPFTLSSLLDNGEVLEAMTSPPGFQNQDGLFTMVDNAAAFSARRRSTGAPEGIHPTPYNVYCRRSSINEPEPEPNQHKKSGSFLTNLRLAHRTRGHSISCDEDVESHDPSLDTPLSHSSIDSGHWSLSPNPNAKDRVLSNMLEAIRPRSKSDCKSGRNNNVNHTASNKACTMRTIPSMEECNEQTSPKGKDGKRGALYVDTQLANRGIEQDRAKKSPISVNAVMDFVRGSSRKQHSPSCDGPLNHYRRISANSTDITHSLDQYVTVASRRSHLTAMRSLDSGLDFSQQSHSPAMVFKQEVNSRPLPAFILPLLYDTYVVQVAL